MTAASMLAQARKSLGMSGRPNAITKEYASRHGTYFLRAPWCQMAITYWARHSDNAAAVLPAGEDRAYTVWAAQDFQKIGRWHTGTAANLDKSRPGDIVFFDWGATNDVEAIDHVGVIEKALGGGRVQTLEGNTSDQCLRRIRSAAVIAGYGRPAYSGAESHWTEVMVKKLPTLSPGDKGEHVESLQGLLLARSHPEVKMTGVFDAATEKALRAVQEWGGVDVDGVCGQQSWPVVLRVHK